MLHSSLHCKVPNGAIDITSVLIFLNALTDAPHFLMEFIQGSPTPMVVILDLLPRKDLALHPEYLHKYYEHTHLDKQHEKIEELPQTRPYRSPSLFVRSACSPTAVSVTIDCGQGGDGTLEEIVCGHLASAVKEVLHIWLHSCARDTSEMEEAEREIMIKRDQVVRLKSIEVDQTAILPRMFGPDVFGHIIAEIRKAFGVNYRSPRIQKHKCNHFASNDKPVSVKSVSCKQCMASFCAAETAFLLSTNANMIKNIVHIFLRLVVLFFPRKGEYIHGPPSTSSSAYNKFC